MQKRGRKGIWQITVGGLRRSSGTTDKRLAGELEAKLNHEIYLQERLGIAPKKTWDEACFEWFNDIGKKLASAKNQYYVANALQPHLGKLYLTQITKEVVAEVMASRVTQEASPQNNTTNQRVDFIKKILKHSGVLPPKFAKYPGTGGRDRWLTVEEWGQLSEVMSPDFRDICTFALVTGIREANVIFFRWEWVKGDVMHIPSNHTKTNKAYTLPLNSMAMEILERRRKAAVTSLEYAFLRDGSPWNKTRVGKYMSGAVEKSGVEKVVFHGLRHSFASLLTQDGVPDSIVDRLGCWTMKGGTGRRYSHLAVEHLRPHSERICTILAQEKTVIEQKQAVS